jgi:hypothetical protein
MANDTLHFRDASLCELAYQGVSTHLECLIGRVWMGRDWTPRFVHAQRPRPNPVKSLHKIHTSETLNLRIHDINCALLVECLSCEADTASDADVDMAIGGLMSTLCDWLFRGFIEHANRQRR